MQVHSLFFYPVKSLGGIRVDTLELDEFGPAGDRRWMIIDDQNRFVTQRRLPALARVSTAYSDGQVAINIPGEGEFPLQPGTERLEVQVWRDQVTALAGAEDAASALSRYCDMALRLVYMPDDSFRRVDPERVAESRRVGFADGFPFLVVNDASLGELNTRLESPVDIRRFRPNIVVDGAAPWDEDGWRCLKIGDRRFDLAKPCSRCVMTTVDPETGVKDSGTQPLKMLASYRKTKDGVIFGQNAVHDGPGQVSVGDMVSVLQEES